jgi:hypothetical protein
LEWAVPRLNEWDNSYWDDWESIRGGSSNIELDLTSTPPSAVLKISQQDYLDHWAMRYGEDKPPQSTNIKMRWSVWDPSQNQWSTRKDDEFTVQVLSSNESKASFCDFTKLSIDEMISGDRTYQVNPYGEEPEMFSIYVSTNLVEANGGAGLGCLDQLTMSLETYMPSDEYWMQIQDEFTPF